MVVMSSKTRYHEQTRRVGSVESEGMVHLDSKVFIYKVE
jgi:hypothetical protein